MNIRINKRLALSSCAAIFALSALAQDEMKVTGRIVDQKGEPIPGASVIVEGTTIGTIADLDGNYSISVPAGKSIVAAFVGYNQTSVMPSNGQTVYEIVLMEPQEESEFVNQAMSIGAYKDLTRAESTAAVSVITNATTDLRSAKNIGNSILGQGNGLVSLDGSGTYFEKNPTFYVRGLQSLNEKSPLILVDGVERGITTIAPQDVQEVQILKDAAAVALYGYKGANNVILIKTKRGESESTSIKVGFEFLLNSQVDRPKFVDGVTYAKARNEALANEGLEAEYSDLALKVFEDGSYPNYYPNVDWVNETFKDKGTSRRYNIEFCGGGKRFKYFTSLNLLADDGFIRHAEENYGYSTQDMYSRGNLRNNMDIKLTDYTDLQINIAGVLSEMSRPGDQANIWGNVYTTPSLAFPIKNEHDTWGGTDVWVKTNPVALSSGAAYYKLHERALFTDISVDQSLGMFIEGLHLHGRMAYDNFSTLYENHSKEFIYGKTITKFVDGDLAIEKYYSDGVDGEMGSGANTNGYERRANLVAGLSLDRKLTDSQSIFAQLRWDYDFTDTQANSSTLHRQNITWYSHYGLMGKYYVDVALDASGSNRLAPKHKWNFSPTVSAAWVISNADFLKTSDLFNLLKLRASFGKINTDWLPRYKDSNKKWVDVWTYYTQSYSRDNNYFPLGSDYSYGETSSRASLGNIATKNPTVEKAYKLNVGLDARLLNCLDVEIDWFRQTNKDAWVSGAGSYTAVIGFGAPYLNEGESTSTGFEVALNFGKKIGEVDINLGGAFNYNHSEIVNMAEEPKAYENLKQTGNALESVFGLVAIGLFKDEAEIAASPSQKFTTVRPGDIKYKDVNNDGQIDANDICKIGHSTMAPEITYNFHVGAEMKGIGVKAFFNGVGKYSAILNTENYYWGVYNNKNISQEVYDGRWTPTNLAAKYPRLSSATNANNYQTSTFWLRDRSYLKLRNVELYYDFKALLESSKVVHGAKLFVRGIDLFTKDKIDNRDAATYDATAPSTRSFVAGFSLTF